MEGLPCPGRTRSSQFDPKQPLAAAGLRKRSVCSWQRRRSCAGCGRSGSRPSPSWPRADLPIGLIDAQHRTPAECGRPRASICRKASASESGSYRISRPTADDSLAATFRVGQRLRSTQVIDATFMPLLAEDSCSHGGNISHIKSSSRVHRLAAREWRRSQQSSPRRS
jgi:hypothetical protein